MAEWPQKYGIHLACLPLGQGQSHAWSALEEALVTTEGKTTKAMLSRHLTPAVYAVPPTTGPEGDRCLLSPTPVCSRFLAPELNAFVGRLFAAVATASALQPGLPQVSLSRYDLFHAHLFLAMYQPSTPVGSSSSHGSHIQTVRHSQSREERTMLLSGYCWRSRDPADTAADRPEGGQDAANEKHKHDLGLGLLFHCKEYPAFHERAFPHRLGYCQAGSNVAVGPDYCMRNVVFFKGALAFLDAGRGKLANDLVWPEVAELCTIFEHDLGESLADINYLEDHRPHNQPHASDAEDMWQNSVYVAAA